MPVTRYLSTFAERVEVLSAYANSNYSTIDDAGTGPIDGYLYSESLTQWLTDGAAEIINLLPQKYKNLMSSEVTFTAGTPDGLNTTNVYNITLDGKPCRSISAKLKGRYDDASDINFPTANDPVFFIENNTIDILPDSGTGRYSEVQYPTIEYNHTNIGAINLTGVTATTAGNFSKTDHGLSPGDRIQLSNVSGQSTLNGFISTILAVADANTFTITGLVVTSTITDCNVTKLGGFPDEAVYLIVLYAAMKGLQHKMAFLVSETVNSQDLDSIVTLMDTAVDRIDADLWTDTALFDPDDNETSLVMVRDALDKARTIITDDAEHAALADVTDEPSSSTYSALHHHGNEDVELVKSALDIVSAELQRASAHLKEWDTIAATALKEAQGYAEVIKTRMAKMNQEYAWYEKQYVNLKGDYMRGLSSLGVNVGGGKR